MADAPDPRRDGSARMVVAHSARNYKPTGLGSGGRRVRWGVRGVSLGLDDQYRPVITVGICHMLDGTQREDPESGKHSANWPCKTEAGLEFYRLLSGSQIPSSLRGAVGKLLNKHEVTEGNEFKLAKRRLAEFPNAPWKRKFVHEDGHEELVTHYRDPLVLMQHILRHPKCDPATDLVFGPEVETDGAACEPGYFADLCNGIWCAPPPPHRPLAGQKKPLPLPDR